MYKEIHEYQVALQNASKEKFHVRMNKTKAIAAIERARQAIKDFNKAQMRMLAEDKFLV